MRTLDTLVVGGGVSGLATGWCLADAGATVEVWEGSRRPGGKIRTESCDGYLVEHAATLMMRSGGPVREFLTATGLDDALQVVSPSMNRYLVSAGKLSSLPRKPHALLASSLWSARGRLRMLLEPLVAPTSVRDETVKEFVVRRFGRELYETAMEPYVAGPLASDPERACARSVLPKLTEMERRCGSVTAGMLWSRVRRRREVCRADSVTFAGGMRILPDRLAADPAVGFRSGLQVTEIFKEKNLWTIRAVSDAGDEVAAAARHVVLATQSAAAAALVAGIDGELAGLLGDIEHVPLSVVHLGFDRAQISHPLDGAGFLAPARERLPVNGVLWMNSLAPGSAPQGRTLLTSYLGGARHPGAVEWSDGRSVDSVLGALKKLIGVGGEPDFAKIVRHDPALPHYVGAYHKRTAAIRDRLHHHATLHICAGYLGGVAVRNRIECARLCADGILDGLGLDSAPDQAPSVLEHACLSGA